MVVRYVLASTILIVSLQGTAIATGAYCAPGYGHIGGTCIMHSGGPDGRYICKPVGGVCVKISSSGSSPAGTYNYCDVRNRRNCIRVTIAK